MPPWPRSRSPAFWAISAECFSPAFIEMAAHVCMHARCSLILHKALAAQLFRENLSHGVEKEVKYSSRFKC